MRVEEKDLSADCKGIREVKRVRDTYSLQNFQSASVVVHKSCAVFPQHMQLLPSIFATVSGSFVSVVPVAAVVKRRWALPAPTDLKWMNIFLIFNKCFVLCDDLT